MRRVARADGSVGRILDGHLNAVERLAVQAPPELRDRELAAVAAGGLRAGVWGADPRARRGAAGRASSRPPGEALRGVRRSARARAACDRALVLARDRRRRTAAGASGSTSRDGERVEVDERWFRGAGCARRSSTAWCSTTRRSSRSARRAGRARRAAVVRAATRCARPRPGPGMADAAVEAALAELAARPAAGELEALAAGRIATRAGDDRRCGSHAGRARRWTTGARPSPASPLHARTAIADACRALLDEAARASGSRPFATGVAAGPRAGATSSCSCSSTASSRCSRAPGAADLEATAGERLRGATSRRATAPRPIRGAT